MVKVIEFHRIDADSRDSPIIKALRSYYIKRINDSVNSSRAIRPLHSFSAGIDFSQILTSEVGPRAELVNKSKIRKDKIRFILSRT